MVAKFLHTLCLRCDAAMRAEWIACVARGTDVMNACVGAIDGMARGRRCLRACLRGKWRSGLSCPRGDLLLFVRFLS